MLRLAVGLGWRLTTVVLVVVEGEGVGVRTVLMKGDSLQWTVTSRGCIMM